MNRRGFVGRVLGLVGAGLAAPVVLGKQPNVEWENPVRSYMGVQSSLTKQYGFTMTATTPRGPQVGDLCIKGDPLGLYVYLNGRWTPLTNDEKGKL